MKEITIWDPAEYAYPLAFGFIPHMRPYMLEDDRVHPCMLIAPGGGYAFVSPSEGELVANAHHVFSRGRHGSSVATSAWAHCLFGEHYTMDQNERLLAAVRDGSFPVTPDELAFLEELIEHHYDNRKDAPYPEVTPWPFLADLFLKTL